MHIPAGTAGADEGRTSTRAASPREGGRSGDGLEKICFPVEGRKTMTMAMNYYDTHGGVEADQAAREYAAQHKVSYREALYTLNGQGKAADRERNYDSLVGDVINEGKRRHGEDGTSLPDSVFAILKGEPNVARRIAGNWIDNMAKIWINNLNLGSSLNEAYPIA